MSETPEQVELHELDQKNISDTTSQVRTVTSPVGSKFKEELEDSEHESDFSDHDGPENEPKEPSYAGSNSDISSDGGEAEENSPIAENKGKQPASESSGSENSSDDLSDEGESIAPATPTRNTGKQPASEGPRSILKKDAGKERAVVPIPENKKNKTKRCTRCNRSVFRIRRRSLPSNVNSTAEEATDQNTIYNLEGYHTSDPVTILCDRCSAVGKTLDRYKTVTVIGGKKLVKDTDDSRRMRRKYRTAVVEREKALARHEKRKHARASSKTAAVAFAEGVSKNGAGVGSDAASAASVASTVSFGPLPEPVDGIGAIRRTSSFCRGKKHYKPGRWSWEATWERGDLEEYDYEEDCGSSDGTESSMASTIVESSAMGAARGAAQEPEDREETQGWLDTSGLTLKPQDFYDGVQKPAKRTGNNSTPTDNTAHRRYHFDPETRTIRRKKETTLWEYLKELGKFWCSL